MASGKVELIHGWSCFKVKHRKDHAYEHAADHDGPVGRIYCGRCHKDIPWRPRHHQAQIDALVDAVYDACMCAQEAETKGWQMIPEASMGKLRKALSGATGWMA
jgi:predicted metal-binding protein